MGPFFSQQAKDCRISAPLIAVWMILEQPSSWTGQLNVIKINILQQVLWFDLKLNKF